MSVDWKLVGLAAAGVGAVSFVGGLYAGYKIARRPKSRKAKEEENLPLKRYLQDHNTENATLSQLREMSRAHSRGRLTTRMEVTKLLSLICGAMKAEKCLDIGVFTGCSSFAMALSLPKDGKVIACDVSEEFANLGLPYWEQEGLSKKIDLRIQPATTTLQELIDNGEEGTFDVMFIDADKNNYPNYFQLGVKLLRAGGMILVDNALWNNAVVDASDTESGTVSIRSMNDLMRDDPRVEFLLLDICDGVGVAQKL